MFKKGDKVRIDLAAWNEWRRKEGMRAIDPAMEVLPCTIYDPSRGRDSDGHMYMSIKIGEYRRNCPVSLIRPDVMDKKAISEMLVRMQ